MKTFKQSLKTVENRRVDTIDFDSFYEDNDQTWQYKTKRPQVKHWRKLMRKTKLGVERFSSY